MPAMLRIALLAGGALHAGMAGAAAPEPVNLSTRDAGLVAKAACTRIGSTGAEHIEGTRRGVSRSIQVTVQCKPHGTDHSVPVARHTTCDNAHGTWRCDPGRDALLVAMPDASTLPVLADGVTSLAAIEAVRQAAKLTIRPFYRPAARVMKGSCTVSETRTARSKGMNSFQIRCGETLIVLTRDCWDGQCRFFIPFAQNY